jgi:hypothetical protein
MRRCPSSHSMHAEVTLLRRPTPREASGARRFIGALWGEGLAFETWKLQSARGPASALQSGDTSAQSRRRARLSAPLGSLRQAMRAVSRLAGRGTIGRASVWSARASAPLCGARAFALETLELQSARGPASAPQSADEPAQSRRRARLSAPLGSLRQVMRAVSRLAGRGTIGRASVWSARASAPLCGARALPSKYGNSSRPVAFLPRSKAAINRRTPNTGAISFGPLRTGAWVSNR